MAQPSQGPTWKSINESSVLTVQKFDDAWMMHSMVTAATNRLAMNSEVLLLAVGSRRTIILPELKGVKHVAKTVIVIRFFIYVF
jgi:hypothetical protein